MTRVISLIIQSELEQIETQSNTVDHPSVVQYRQSDTHRRQISRQACKAYHALYHGEADYIEVIDHTNTSYNKRRGIITEYCVDSGLFVIRLATKNTPCPTRYSGECATIGAEYLVHLPNDSQFANQNRPLPPSHSVTIFKMLPSLTSPHVTLVLEKSRIKLINDSLPNPDNIRIEFVRPLVMTHRRQDELTLILQREQSSIPSDPFTQSHRRWRYHDECGVYTLTRRRPKRHNASPTPTQSFKKSKVCSGAKIGAHLQCPCHGSVACTHRYLCGPIDDKASPSTDAQSYNHNHHSAVISDKEDIDVSAAQFGLTYLIRPDDILFDFPFHTVDSIVPFASARLNELNIARDFAVVPSEEEIMQRLSKYPVSITNKDMCSLYPSENITGAMAQFAISW